VAVLSSSCAVTTQRHLTYPRAADVPPDCEISGKWRLDAALAVVSAAAALTGALLANGSRNPTNADVAGGVALGTAGGLGTLVFGASAVRGMQWNGDCERAKDDQPAHRTSAP
jgi:hypothetical protein